AVPGGARVVSHGAVGTGGDRVLCALCRASCRRRPAGGVSDLPLEPLLDHTGSDPDGVRGAPAGARRSRALPACLPGTIGSRIRWASRTGTGGGAEAFTSREAER